MKNRRTEEPKTTENNKFRNTYIEIKKRLKIVEVCE
jgi:hypothetical protein